PMDKFLVPGTANITNANLTIESPTRIIVSVGANLRNPLGPIPLPLGEVGMSIYLDGVNLANITTSNLTLPGGEGPVDITAKIDIADGGSNPQLQDSINNLASSLFGIDTPNGPPPKLVIDNIRIA
ncbi:hypothetical protein BGW38_010107, partial [Lunasporangiospora selenospora]